MHGEKKGGAKKVVGTVVLVLILVLIFVRFVLHMCRKRGRRKRWSCFQWTSLILKKNLNDTVI